MVESGAAVVVEGLWSDWSGVVWRKSGRSNGGGNSTRVEVAGLADLIALRDSQDLSGPVLAFPRSEW